MPESILDWCLRVIGLFGVCRPNYCGFLLIEKHREIKIIAWLYYSCRSKDAYNFAGIADINLEAMVYYTT